jgi:OFA family oxalate/formate antiporter-like MFS transporter
MSAFGIKLAEKIGFSGVNWVAFGLYSLVNLLCSQLSNYNLLIYFYSLGSGFSCGLGYLMGIYIAWTYYPDKKGVVTGIILFTAGVSASILSPMTTYILNPTN